MQPPKFWWLSLKTEDAIRYTFYGENNKRISALEYSYSVRPSMSNLRPAGHIWPASLTCLLDTIILSIIWYISTQGQIKKQHTRKMFAFFCTSWLIGYSYVKMETENLINQVIKSLSLLLLLLSFSLILLCNTASEIN